MKKTLTIPFPPSANHIWRAGNGRTYRSKEYKIFLNNVCVAWLTTNRAGWRTDRFYKVEIDLYPQDRRKFDVDNRIKPTLDALTNANVWNDDSQVVSVTATKREPDKRRPRAVVAITPIERKETHEKKKANDSRRSRGAHARNANG